MKKSLLDKLSRLLHTLPEQTIQPEHSFEQKTRPEDTLIDETVNLTFGYSIDALIKIGDSFRLVKGVYDSKDQMAIADQILRGELFSDYFFSKNPSFIPAKINWDIQFSEAPTLYNLGLQSLDMVGILAQAFWITQKIEYISLALTILTDWIQYEAKKPSNRMVWYDHSVASRTLNFIALLGACDRNPESKALFQKIDQMEILQLLERHAAYLLEDINYSFGNNHGVMADRALIALGLFVPEQPQSQVWLKIGKRRMELQFENLFAEDGSYTENSPGYGQGAVFWFVEMDQFLHKFGLSFSIPNFKARLTEAIKFLEHLIMPNSNYVMYGDTLSSQSVLAKFAERLPLPAFAVYPTGGYVFLSDYDHNVWLSCKAGYIAAKAHKHADDLSFVLTIGNNEVFIDPGLYNYEGQNAFRQYFVSALAHNTIIVDQQSFSTSPLLAGNSGIKNWQMFENYWQVTLFNYLFSDVCIERTLYYFSSGCLLIADIIQAAEPHTYSQLFHLGEAVEVLASEKVTQLVVNGYSATINQLIAQPQLTIHAGTIEQPGFGLISRDLNSLSATHTLEYGQHGKVVQYLTLIDLTQTHSGEVENLSDYLRVVIHSAETQQDDELRISKFIATQAVRDDLAATLVIGDVPVQISRTKTSLCSYIYEVKLVDTESISEYVYTWYLHRNKQVIRKENWSASNTYTLTLEQPGHYDLQLYLRHLPTNRRVTQIIDEIILN